MSKHRPGPWHVSKYLGEPSGTLQVVHASGDVQVADCRETWGYRLSVEEAQANARLIAAAPDLLEACKAALAVREKNGMGEVGVSAQLRAVIAKAEGRD